VDHKKLKTLLAAVFRVPETTIAEQTVMKDIDTWDSMTHMEMILTLENEWDITFSGEEIMRMTSFASIVSIVSSKVR
jgi:acyl carrier protein